MSISQSAPQQTTVENNSKRPTKTDWALTDNLTCTACSRVILVDFSVIGMEEKKEEEKDAPWYKNRIVLLLILYFFVRSIRADTSYTQEYLRFVDLDTNSDRNSKTASCDQLGPAYLTYVQGKTQLFQLLFYVAIIITSPQLGLMLSIAMDLGSYFLYLLMKELLIVESFRKIFTLQSAACFLGISLGTSNLIHSQIYSLVDQHDYHQISGLTRAAGTVGHMIGSAAGGLILGVIYASSKVFISNVVSFTRQADSKFLEVYTKSIQSTWRTLLVVHVVIIASSIGSSIISFLVCCAIHHVSKQNNRVSEIEERDKRQNLRSNLSGTFAQFKVPSVIFMSITWSLNLICLLLIRIWASSLWTSNQERLNRAPMNGFASVLTYSASLLGAVTPPYAMKRMSAQQFVTLQTWLFVMAGVLALLQCCRLNHMPVYYVASASLDYITWTCGAFLANELAKKVSKTYVKPFFNLLYIFVYSIRMVIVWYITGFGYCPPVGINNRFLLIALLMFSSAIVNVAIRIDSPLPCERDRRLN